MLETPDPTEQSDDNLFQEPQESDGNDTPIGGQSGANISDDPIAEIFDGENPPEETVEPSLLAETLAESEEATITLTGLALATVNGSRGIVLREGIYDAETDSRILNGEDVILTSDIPGAFMESSAYAQADGPGIIGVATDAGAIPEMGTGTFTGGAVGLVLFGSGGVELRNGQSVVEVNFNDGLVDATLSDFTAVNLVSATLADAPFESMTLTGATLADNGFSGGSLRTNGGDSVADLVGGDSVFEAQGQFFGSTEEGQGPAEVGGLVFTQGNAGTIFGSFIAD